VALRIVSRNLADAAALSAVPPLAAPASESNLQSPLRARVARSGSLDLQAVIASWTAPQTLSFAALWRTNLSAAATWRVEAYSGAGLSGSLLFDSNSDPSGPVPLGLLRWGIDPLGAAFGASWDSAASPVAYFPQVSAQSVRITVRDPGNPAGFIEIGRLIVGQFWEPEGGADYGAAARWADPAPLARTEGGSAAKPGSVPARSLSFSLSWMGEADRAALLDLIAQAGDGGELWASVYAGAGGALERDYAACGRLAGPHDIQALGGLRHGGRVEFEEA
jgi:hypothetical protein